ncbi:hypothetical protein [Rothia nasimurium]|uniref:hypothetical protein n=1 Tax=Rothia nasimurium TaxID=85336 RepID=UPI003BA366A8
MKSRKFHASLPATVLATVLLLPTSTAAFANTSLSTTTPPLQTTPAGEYGYDYKFQILPHHGSKAPLRGHEIWKIIMDDFENVFPLGGMVNNPQVGQELTLTSPNGGSPVKVLEVGDRHLKLLSLPGHFEGADNTIIFAINDEGSELHVQADGPKAAQFPENLVPYPLWGNFANRIIQKIYPNEPGGVIPSNEVVND